jgi:uncharacterized membrane protein YciS (DUF1049 family)
MSDAQGHRSLRKFGIPRVAELLGITDSKLSFWEIMASTAFAIGTLTIMMFSAPFDAGWWVRAGTMFSIASGISPSAHDVIAFTPNTNLEQISDWLTKIIVGATLVQIGTIRVYFSKLCLWVGEQLHQPIAGIFCGGIVIYFFFAGFLWGYLWCSIRIFREMVHLTTQLQEKT